MSYIRIGRSAPPITPTTAGWNILPLGCGGFVTGMFIANDGTMVCRTDVGNGYRFSGLTTDYANSAKQWLPVMNYTSLGSTAVNGGTPGMWEHVLAPNHSSVHGAIFPDMQGTAGKSWFWYSTNSAGTWNKSNLSFLNYAADSNETLKFAQQKIVFDPANPDIVYLGTPNNDGNSAGAYTSLNKSGGSSLATLVSVKTSGSTPIPATTLTTYTPTRNRASGVLSNVSAGLAIDAASGTTTIGGQTVTNRIIIPIAGAGIYESTDGGNTFTEIASSAMGTADFYVVTGYFTAEGIYYCIVVNSTIGGVWRYKSGTWTNISPSSGAYNPPEYVEGQAFLIVDPRNTTNAKKYLSVFGANGFGTGFTSQDANTAATPSWTGKKFGQAAFLRSEAYDLGYINYEFGQGPDSYTAANGAVIDLNGTLWWPGNQSLFYLGTSDVNSTAATAGGPVYPSTGGTKRFIGNTSGSSTSLTVSTDPIYGAPAGIAAGMVVSGLGIPDGITIVSQSSGTAGTNGVYVVSAPITAVNTPCILDGFRTYSWSMGRGMEATVAEDALCPPGGTYPVLAVQDLGAPMRGTLASYPQDTYARYLEYTCEAVEYAANDPSFVVARVTDQGAHFDDVSGYSTNYGADGSWTQFAANPTSLWQAQITATVSDGSGGSGTILNVTSKASGTIFPYAQIWDGGALGSGNYFGRVQPYGTNGSTGTGGVGTYAVDFPSLASSRTMYSVTPIQGGQTVAVDSNHMVTCPAGLNTITLGQWVVPAYTTDQGATWQLCNGLPEGGYISRPWSFGPGCKPFAVGYGTDLNTVWAALRKGTTLTLYRSTDKGANFSSVGSVTTSNSCEGIYCLSMPGFPNELWLSGKFVGGSNTSLWHVTNANTSSATFTAVNFPSPINGVRLLALGAPASPGGYPTIFMQGVELGNTTPPVLYEGTYPGSGATVSWAILGATGKNDDLPKTCQLQGLSSIRGDWNTYRRLYAATSGCGLAYYTP